MLQRLERAWFQYIDLASASRLEWQVTRRLKTIGDLRIAFVKQDTQDDLYCCPRHSKASQIVFSTLMRSGPVALFTRLSADFLIVETEPDAECQAWTEKALDLGWFELDALKGLRAAVPGRDYGQSAFASRCDDVNWSEFDIVISVDVSVPARITRKFPNTLWCYYIREPKTNSYRRSQRSALPGQDLFLNQTFDAREHGRLPHALCFPYYLQYYGCFHELLNRQLDDSFQRPTLFLEHQTPDAMMPEQLHRLSEIGSLDSTSRLSAGQGAFAPPNQKCRRSPLEIISALLGSRYFIAFPNYRNLWGNAAVEAVAAGALVLGNPDLHTHRDLFSKRTSVYSFDDLLERLQFFDRNPAAYAAELQLQRRIVDYLCYWRPVRDLLQVFVEHRKRP